MMVSLSDVVNFIFGIFVLQHVEVMTHGNVIRKIRKKEKAIMKSNKK